MFFRTVGAHDDLRATLAAVVAGRVDVRGDPGTAGGAAAHAARLRHGGVRLLQRRAVSLQVGHPAAARPRHHPRGAHRSRAHRRSPTSSAPSTSTPTWRPPADHVGLAPLARSSRHRIQFAPLDGADSAHFRLFPPQSAEIDAIGVRPQIITGRPGPRSASQIAPRVDMRGVERQGPVEDARAPVQIALSDASAMPRLLWALGVARRRAPRPVPSTRTASANRSAAGARCRS